MGLNTKQKEAVEYLEGPLLVLAGPGTGKTQLLSEKVAYILKNTDTNPENILCLTFTETGAANMRERLKTIIGRAGTRVTIGTYHAFGQEILAQYKNYAEDYDRKLDNAIDEVTQFKIVKKIRDGLSGRDILRGDNVKDIISVISEAKAAGLSSDDLMKVAEQNMADSEVISEAISSFLKKIVPRAFRESYEKAYRPIFEVLKEYQETKPIVLGVERSIAGMSRDLEAAITEAEEKQKITPLSAWKDKYFEKDSRGEYRLKDRVANKKLLSIARVMGGYQEHLQMEGLFDFDDMIEEAARALEADAGFRMSLSEKYQFILLDEFQDTNPSQFRIVKLLTDYEKPMIMAVGDDDQAIYEFQGAMSTNLRDFERHFKAKVVTLEENYRSTQEILDFSREIIRQAPDRFADKKLIAHRPAAEMSQIFRHEFLAANEEYEFVAREIVRLIRAGVKQSEIAVISYKTKYFMPLIDYLKERPEIKIAYEKRDNLLEDEKIHQIITIFRLVLEIMEGRKTSVSMLEVLSYPFLGVPIIEAIQAVGAAREARRPVFEYLAKEKESFGAELSRAVEFLAKMVERGFVESFEVLLGMVLEKIEAVGMEEYERFRFYENLAALKGRMARHFGEKRLVLKDLIEMVDDYEAAEMMMSVSSPYRDADEAVQILTAHKAKGLEFSYVFLISADHVAWGKGKGNNNLLALPKNLAQIRHTGTTDGEKLRILYVALTRAKERIVISNSLYDFKGKAPDRLEYFGEYVEKDAETGAEEVISPFLPRRKVILEYGENNRGQAGAVDFSDRGEASAVQDSEKLAFLPSLERYVRPYLTAIPDMRAIYKERMEKYRMSATGLTSFVDIVYAGPVEFFKRQILKAPGEPETEALAVGNLIHKVFEAVTNRGISDTEAVELFLTELEKSDLEVEVKEKIREKWTEDLLVCLTAFSEALRDGKAEVDLAHEKITIAGVPVTGKIDHLKIDEVAKTIEIYDFKTGNYHKEKWRSHATLYKYMLQLGFYKLLLNNSPTFSKYRVERAHILFVKPDGDGEVYDKVYEFNQEDEEELISLIQAVYRQVADVRFLDDAEIFRAANKEAGLSDIREFVALLIEKSGE